VATPLIEIVTGPGASTSNRIAPSAPLPEAPSVSAGLVTAMSTRPADACWLKTVLTPPDRIKLPSWTLRARNLVGSNVMTIVTVDSRDASFTVSGTV
jgi:hypothetical protein